jgi:hypothetical protein
MTVGLLLALGGLGRWLDGNSRGAGVVVAGVAVVLACLGVFWWVGRTWQRALAADSRDARESGRAPVPFGARPRGDGVVLRPRAAIRLVPPLLVSLMLLTAWGMAADGLPVQAAVVVVGSGALLLLWLYARSYEICLDASGIWRRRRPRWRLAWTDLQYLERKPTSNRWYPDRPDDLLLHGHITTPHGRARDVARLRCNLLAVPPDELRALVDRCRGSATSATRPWSSNQGGESPFQHWD